MKTCPQCGNELVYRKGISKRSGRPWEGYFCPDRDCGFVEWVRSEWPAKDKYKKALQPDNMEIISNTLGDIVERLKRIEKKLEQINSNSSWEGHPFPDDSTTAI